ncbi:MAG: 16S rRNA (guanine(527)-N(7))-methyltransferase RsmG [Deltaproteobacteria bacterium]|nr:16S rRNA (guanine(527)-N(7))-methyltransferase RsmG [Deltaproteobacteria bacterium]
MPAVEYLVSPEAVRLVHFRLLEEWRTAMNLVGPGPVDPHFDDCEAAVRRLDPRGRWADLGSGAGFPGIAFAAWHPEVTLTLVESRQKRAAFLEQVVREAGLPNASVLCGRVEDLPRAAFDGVIARAFAPPAQTLETALPLLVPGGQAVLLIAKEVPPEVRGFRKVRQEAYSRRDHARNLVVYERIQEAETSP